MRRLDCKQEDQTNIKWSIINLENKRLPDNGPAQLWVFPSQLHQTGEGEWLEASKLDLVRKKKR